MFRTSRVAAILCGAAALLSHSAFAQPTKPWEFQASVYAYVPTISGTTTFPPRDGGSSVSVGEDILDNLKMAFMGSLEGSNGTWGVLTDLVYMDVGDARSGTRSISIGGMGLPAGASANVDYDLKGWAWILAGTYRLVSDRESKIDLLAGTRVLDVRQTLSWSLAGNVGSIALADRAGTRELDEQNWDVIVGAKGRTAFGDGKWFVPYYLDVGTGDSKVTWQAYAGVGYSFGWGDIVGVWRYLDYEMKSGKAIENLDFNGPAIAAVFRW